ncbi:LysR substrate-binding domain-containing protein [Halomonas sp. DQ26W]|uniref:LysR substrate-binding domain-containing protein n=1 Tax=Halomonas sp. DQ26W TaxID=2282311 RepID=UPI0038560081
MLEPQGVTPNGVAQVDQEACMLDLVRAGVGLSLARDALAMGERQEQGLVVVEGGRLPCSLNFIWQRQRSDEPAIAAALGGLEEVWPTQTPAKSRRDCEANDCEANDCEANDCEANDCDAEVATAYMTGTPVIQTCR